MNNQVRQSQAITSFVVLLACLIGISCGARVKRFERSFEVRSGPDSNDVPEDSPFKTHYEALGLNNSATPEEIKKAGKKRVLKTHPDKATAQGEDKEIANRKFRAVQKAREVLEDPARKEKYDKSLAAAKVILVKGNSVVAVEIFNTKDTGAKGDQTILKGAKGIVQEIDGDGDAFIIWEGVPKAAPLLSKYWHLVKVAPPNLVKGSKVVALQEFKTDETGGSARYIIPKGAKGIVQEIDRDGDAFIVWENVPKAAPLLSKHWLLVTIDMNAPPQGPSGSQQPTYNPNSHQGAHGGMHGPSFNQFGNDGTHGGTPPGGYTFGYDHLRHPQVDPRNGHVPNYPQNGFAPQVDPQYVPSNPQQGDPRYQPSNFGPTDNRYNGHGNLDPNYVPNYPQQVDPNYQPGNHGQPYNQYNGHTSNYHPQGDPHHVPSYPQQVDPNYHPGNFGSRPTTHDPYNTNGQAPGYSPHAGHNSYNPNGQSGPQHQSMCFPKQSGAVSSLKATLNLFCGRRPNERCATRDECVSMAGRWKDKYCTGGYGCGCCKEIGMHR